MPNGDCVIGVNLQVRTDNLEKDFGEMKSDIRSLVKKLDAIKNYIIGLFGSMILAVVLLLIQRTV